MLILIISSCKKTNNYYSDPNNSEIERIVHVSSNYKLAISALGHENYLEVLVSTELYKNNALKNIVLKINGLSYTPTKKELYFEDGRTIYFKNFSDLKDLNCKNPKKYVIRFYFDNSKLKSPNDLSLELFIESNKGSFQERFIMKRHARYKIIA